jgi:hypothetical protein
MSLTFEYRFYRSPTKRYIDSLLHTFVTLFPPRLYHGHMVLLLLLGNEGLICPAAHVNGSWNMYIHAWEHNVILPDSTPQRHDAANPGIKLSHLVY